MKPPYQIFVIIFYNLAYRGYNIKRTAKQNMASYAYEKNIII